MLNLPTTASVLQVVTGSPVSTIAVHASWADSPEPTASPVLPNSLGTPITTATTTPVVPAPAPGTNRNVKFLSVNNTSASPCVITVQVFDGTNAIPVWGPFSLPAGWAVHYNTDVKGFVLYDSTGSEQLTAAIGSYLTQTTWFVNYATGNNANTGLTSGAALASVGEIRRRWNGGVLGVRPQLPSLTYTITVAGAPANPYADPLQVLWDLDVCLGTTIDIEFTPTVLHTGTIASVPNPFSQTATGQQTITDAAISNWTPYINMLLVDTTTGAACWITGALTAPARGVLSSAYEAVTVSSLVNAINNDLTPSSVNATDSYQILQLPNVYFGGQSLFRLAPGGQDSAGNSQANCLVRRAAGVANGPSDMLQVEGNASFPATVQTGATVSFVDCQFNQQRKLDMGGAYWINCAGLAQFPGQDNFTSIDFSAAVLSGYNTTSVTLGNGIFISNDFFVLNGGDIVFNDGQNAGGAVFITNIGRFLNGAPANNIFAVDQRGATFEITGVIYGQTGGDPIAILHNGGALTVQGTAAATFITDGGSAATFQMGGNSGLGFYFDEPTATWLPAGGKAITVANLDAARPGGFGSTAIDPKSDCRILVHGIF